MFDIPLGKLIGAMFYAIAAPILLIIWLISLITGENEKKD